MANAEPPVQKWNVRIVLKSGVLFDIVTEMTPEDIAKRIQTARETGLDIVLNGLNEKRWPVTTNIVPTDLSCYIINPLEVYLAARPNLSIN